MFAAVCSGRPISLANQVEVNKYVINIANANNIGFITIFLLPNQEFDPNYTALIYIQLPNKQEFELLGGLSSLKPSAIYKLNSSLVSTGIMDDDPMNLDTNQFINIGISIEPTSIAETQLQAKIQPLQQQQSISKPDDTASLANKIVGHAYNYLGGFTDLQGKVPMKAFDTWWDKFKLKLSNNPNFLNELKD